MAPPTGSNSSPISSSPDTISYSAETPQVLELGRINMRPTAHSLTPWMANNQGNHLQRGRAHAGIEWISVKHLGTYGDRQLRLIYNARAVLLEPLRFRVSGIGVNSAFDIQQEVANKLLQLRVNDNDIVLHAPPSVIAFPPERLGRRYFPPGALQICVDENDLPVNNQHTTLPNPESAPFMPCSGWCKKQHIYVDYGMTEKTVIFFNRSGWPIACRENVVHDCTEPLACLWWRFDYSRPMPSGEV